MKKQRSNIWAKIVLITFGIALVCLGPLWLYDNFSDRTKIFKEAITLVQNELDTIKRDFFGYEYDKTKPFIVNGTLTAVSTGKNINLSGIYKDTDNYEGAVKLDDDITYSLQSNELYLKKNNNTYKLNLSSENLINMKNTIDNYMALSNNSFYDIMFNLNDIFDGLDSKEILKKRIKTDINNKNTLTTLYSYKLNTEMLRKLGVDELGFENREYSLDIYTKFKKIVKIEIKDIVSFSVNNDNVVMNYYAGSSYISVSKNQKNFSLAMYSNDVKTYECNVNIDKDFSLNIKAYNEDTVIKELNIVLVKKDIDNGINYIVSINDSYKSDIMLSYVVSNFINVSSSTTLSSEETFKINEEVYNSLINNDVIKGFLEVFNTN